MTNMNIKHTPGPWKIDPYSYHRIVLSPGGQIVAGCHGHQPVRLANARLIAAAPEMYDLIAEAGDAIADMFEQLTRGKWVDDHGHDVRLNCQMIALTEWIMKAIALRAEITEPVYSEELVELNRLIDANQAALSKATAGDA